MADTKISDLTAVTAPATTDVVAVVDAAETKKVTLENLVKHSGGQGQLMAGTTTKAPLQFQAGDLLTATSAGAVEFDNDDFYMTITTGAGADYVSQYPPTHTDTYVKATTHSEGTDQPYYSTDPAKSLTGAQANNQWISQWGHETNQRFHVDLGEAKVIKRIYYENAHSSGNYTDWGVKDFTIQGSNDGSSFADLTYATNTGWTTIATDVSQMVQHPATNTEDPHYVVLTNTVAYRYYALKIAGTWQGTSGGSQAGIRRLVFQTGVSARKRVVTSDIALIEHAIPLIDAAGRLASMPVGATGKILTGVTNSDPVWADPAAFTPVLTVSAAAAAPASVNLSTEGTIDWVCPNGNYTVSLRQAAYTAVHAKVNGGPLLAGCDWLYAGATTYATTGGMQKTSVATDDLYGTAMADDTAYCAIYKNGTGEGFRLSVPASTTQQTLRIYFGQWSCVVTVIATLSGSGISAQTVTYDSGASSGRNSYVDVVFKGQGGQLTVSLMVTTDRGATPNIQFHAATIF
jgi:hypothetical protein